MSILYGFSFAGVHSSEVGLYVDTPSHAITAALRSVGYAVPGRPGTRDYGGGAFDMLEVPATLYCKSRTPEEMRARQREIAQFLSRSGRLIFDAEPDKAYTGKIEAAVTMEEAARVGSLEVVFRVQPWAESLNYRQITLTGQTLPLTITPQLLGMQETPCVIRIVATAGISGLTVTRVRQN